jgi:hypothetical protein
VADCLVGGGQTIAVGLRVALATLDQPVWGGRSHPMAIGGGWTTLKAQTEIYIYIYIYIYRWPAGVVEPPLRPKLKKKKKKRNFGQRGWPNHPAGPYQPVWVGWSHPQASRGGQATPYGLLATFCFLLF